jgi:hypothetical protein
MKVKSLKPLVKKYSADYWKVQIIHSNRRFEKFIKSAEESIKVFNAIKNIETLKDAPRRLNVWWYCVNTLLPAYYSSTPKAEVNLRKRSGGIPYELGSVILERNTQYAMDCHFDFDKIGYNAALQFLLTGQAVLWAKYTPKFQKIMQEIAVIKDPSGTLLTGDGKPYEGDTEGFTEAGNGILVSSIEVEQKVSEKAVLEVVQYSDYRCSDARNESEIEWQAKRAFLDRFQAEDLFGEEKAAELSYDSIPEVNKLDAAKEEPKFEGKAEVWEIWCEATNKVYWIQTSKQDPLIEELDPPITFEKFYPCSVIRQTQDPDTIIPVSDYTHAKDQILEVERLTSRIHALTQAIRPNFAYDAAMTDIVEQLFQDDLKGVGVKNWPSNKGRGGLQGAIEFLPVEQFVNVLNTLQQARQQALQQLYETLKVSDLLRGTSEQYKSATANRLESQWSSLGLIVRQNMFCKFISDAIMHLGTIIAEQFDEETIFDVGDADRLISETLIAPPPMPMAPPPMPEMPFGGEPVEEPQGMPEAPEGMEAQMPGNPEAQLEQVEAEIIDILRDTKKRNYRIQIASDSMVAIDQAQQQAEGQALIQSAGAFFDQMRGLVDQYPPLIEFSIALFQNMIKRFKGGKELDGIFTKALTQIGEISKAKEEAAKQPPPPDPKTLEIQGRMQIAQVESQARLQATQMEMQDKAVKNQLAAQEQQLKMQRDQLDAQLAVQKQQTEEYFKQQELALAQQEIQVKQSAVQVDMLKVQASAQSESDKALIKQESSQMQHILEIQKLELEQMRIRLSESEKLMEERRLASEQALERVRLQMEQVSSPKIMSMGGMTGRKKSGKIITDDNGNPTAIEITEQPEVKVQRITLDEEGNPSGIELS